MASAHLRKQQWEMDKETFSTTEAFYLTALVALLMEVVPCIPAELTAPGALTVVSNILGLKAYLPFLSPDLSILSQVSLLQKSMRGSLSALWPHSNVADAFKAPASCSFVHSIFIPVVGDGSY